MRRQKSLVIKLIDIHSRQESRHPKSRRYFVQVPIADMAVRLSGAVAAPAEAEHVEVCRPFLRT
jgi:hypothetical protein